MVSFIKKLACTMYDLKKKRRKKRPTKHLTKIIVQSTKRGRKILINVMEHLNGKNEKSWDNLMLEGM